MAKSVVRAQATKRRASRRSTESDTDLKLQKRRRKSALLDAERISEEIPVTPETVKSRRFTADSEIQTRNVSHPEVYNRPDASPSIEPAEFEAENTSDLPDSPVQVQPSASNTESERTSPEPNNESGTDMSMSPELPYMSQEVYECVIQPIAAHNSSADFMSNFPPKLDTASTYSSPANELHSVSPVPKEAIGSSTEEDERENTDNNSDGDFVEEERYYNGNNTSPASDSATPSTAFSGSDEPKRDSDETDSEEELSENEEEEQQANDSDQVSEDEKEEDREELSNEEKEKQNDHSNEEYQRGTKQEQPMDQEPEDGGGDQEGSLHRDNAGMICDIVTSNYLTRDNFFLLYFM